MLTASQYIIYISCSMISLYCILYTHLTGIYLERYVMIVQFLRCSLKNTYINYNYRLTTTCTFNHLNND